MDGGDTATISSVITGSAGLNVAGGTLVLDGDNSGYTGETTLASGTLAVGNNNALGTNVLFMVSGTTLQAASSVVTIANGVDLPSGSVTFDTNSNTLTLTGPVFQNAMPSSLNKVGAGKLVLGDTNSYTGGTTLYDGTLELGTLGSIAGNLAFGGTATLLLDASTSQISGDISGFAIGDGIDLGFQGFVSGDKAVWQQNGASGVLSLETSGGTVLDTLNLTGQYSSPEFTVSAASNAGTLIQMQAYVAPTLTAQNFFVSERHSVAIYKHVALSNPDGDNVSIYFYDEDVGKAHFTVGGQTEPNKTWFDVSANDLSLVGYVGSSSPGRQTGVPIL